MRYLLDTNVLSEVMKPQPAEGVATWMRSQPLPALFTASICCAENRTFSDRLAYRRGRPGPTMR